MLTKQMLITIKTFILPSLSVFSFTDDILLHHRPDLKHSLQQADLTSCLLLLRKKEEDSLAQPSKRSCRDPALCTALSREVMTSSQASEEKGYFMRVEARDARTKPRSERTGRRCCQQLFQLVGYHVRHLYLTISAD